MSVNGNFERLFKGDKFSNRYRISGTLKTLSPLHVGSGEAREDPQRVRATGSKAGQAIQISTILKDYRGRPYIPGSSLKGIMRHWLWSVLACMGEKWALLREYSSEELTELSQAEQQERVKSNFSWLELLFGTPFHEGKVEFWDSCCITKELSFRGGKDLLNWDPVSLTYVDTSVAIDPATGTAAEHLLYQFEVVPPGVEFEFNLCGQNLSPTELGLLFLALQGFNSQIYPIQVGAHSGRGFGRVEFKLDSIRALDAADLKAWVQKLVYDFGETSQVVDAGYFALPVLGDGDQKKLIADVKKLLLEQIGK
jgi:CRISPR-associated protein Csm3